MPPGNWRVPPAAALGAQRSAKVRKEYWLLASSEGALEWVWRKSWPLTTRESTTSPAKRASAETKARRRKTPQRTKKRRVIICGGIASNSMPIRHALQKEIAPAIVLESAISIFELNPP